MNSRINTPPLSIIVCCDAAGGFAKNGTIPWNIPEDMAHFKTVTMGNVCIMGRNTYEDMYDMVKSKKNNSTSSGSPLTKNIVPSEILPGRESFVVTRDVNYKPHGATAVLNLKAAIQSLNETDQREIFVIGGYRMFIEALAWTDKVYMTIIKNKYYDCNLTFPVQILNRSYKIINAKETQQLYFLTYKRTKW